MVITILEAHVAPDKAALLEAAYKQGIERAEPMLSVFDVVAHAVAST